MRTLLATLALTLVGASAAGAAAPSANGPTTSLVITVKSVTSAVAPLDKPPKGFSKGDRYLIRDRLLNVARQFGKPAGAVVGSDAGLWVLTSAKAGTVVGAATLPGGTIRFRGILKVKGAVPPFAVTGGTGKYAAARGTLIVGEGTSPLNTYRLTLPVTSTGTTV